MSMHKNHGLAGGELPEHGTGNAFTWQAQRASERLEHAAHQAVVTGVDATDAEGLTITVDELLDRRQALIDNAVRRSFA